MEIVYLSKRAVIVRLIFLFTIIYESPVAAAAPAAVRKMEDRKNEVEADCAMELFFLEGDNGGLAQEYLPGEGYLEQSSEICFSMGYDPDNSAPDELIEYLVDKTDAKNSDNRIRVKEQHSRMYPFSCICRVDVTLGEEDCFGSGALIGPQHVLTAAHCVCSHNDAGVPVIAKNVSICWPQNDQLKTLKGARIYVPKVYLEQHNVEYDFAVIVLDKRQETGWLGCCSSEFIQAFDDEELNISGVSFG